MGIKTVEIQTLHQVIVTYELTNLRRRAWSTVLDSVFVFCALYLLINVIGTSWISRQLLAGGFFILVWFYHLVFAVFFNGHTLAKRILGIRVMALQGDALGFSDHFLRWVLRPLEITLSAGTIGAFCILGSERGQRLGDMLAGSVVVNASFDIHFTLKDIEKSYEEFKSEEVLYPQVRFLQENDMLFLKNLLRNPNGYSHDVWEEALSKAAVKLSQLLELESTPKDTKAFLQRLVNDYIILTR